MAWLDPLKRVAQLKKSRGGSQGSAGLAPSGQVLTEKFPVLTYGDTPIVLPEKWRFRVWGCVAEPQEWSWEQFLALGDEERTFDIHCVTRWSKLGTRWRGIPAARVIAACQPLPEAQYVMQHAYGGYTTNNAIASLLHPDTLFAFEYDGKPLDQAHGGPMRVIMSNRYIWKGAKWVNGLEFLPEDQPGFWERAGYHANGDPWKEERFAD
jgi:DMSO/TMAO reductase YedYZ molybdopterin-dependent catalytic subunit